MPVPPRTWLRLSGTIAERQLLHQAAAFADCSMNELVLSSTRKRLAADLALELSPAPGDQAKARLSVYSNLSPTERAQLLVVAAAAHQNLSEYMLHAVVTDAYSLLGTAREGGA